MKPTTMRTMRKVITMTTTSRPGLLVTMVGFGALMGAGACATSGELKQDTFAARKKLTGELSARGDYATAFTYADGMHRERPRDAEVLVLRGVIYREKGMPAEAEADLQEALRLDDGAADAHAALGILYDLTHRPERAELEHRRAVALASNSPGYLNNLGFSLFLHGKAEEAIACFARAARLDPTNRRVRTNLGFALASKGDLRGAAREFDFGGTTAEARNNLGFAYERRGDMAHAYDLYREASGLDPGSVRARANLAHAATTLGRDPSPGGASLTSPASPAADQPLGVDAPSP